MKLRLIEKGMKKMLKKSLIRNTLYCAIQKNHYKSEKRYTLAVLNEAGYNVGRLNYYKNIEKDSTKSILFALSDLGLARKIYIYDKQEFYSIIFEMTNVNIETTELNKKICDVKIELGGKDLREALREEGKPVRFTKEEQLYELLSEY